MKRSGADVSFLAVKKPPFKIEEEGWGEFDMIINLVAVDKGGEFSLSHDLNFQSERYEAKHSVVRLRICLGKKKGLMLRNRHSNRQKVLYWKS